MSYDFETFDAFEVYFNESMASESTLNARYTDLQTFCEWAKSNGIESANDISKRTIRDYVEHLASEGYAINTIMSSKYAALGAALSEAYNMRQIDGNPMNRVKTKNVKKVARRAMDRSDRDDEDAEKDHLTREEVYELAEEHAPDPTDRNELLIKLMFWTGVRVSELVGIEIGDDGTLDGPNSDVNPRHGEIRVYAPKTDDNRTVQYPKSEINPLLRDWCARGRLKYKCADRSTKLFLGHKKPITESGVGFVIREAAENMGIQEVKRESVDGREYSRVTPHLLRHSHAMYYHNVEGVPLDVLKDHLGHASVDTTEKHYAETTNDTLRDAFGG